VRKWRVPHASKIKTPPVPWNLEKPALANFRKKLLRWFHAEKRDLPWRKKRDSYRIWISEIMLQQTRVAAVIPYYEKFLRRFPTVRALASAKTESVLQFWAGLGYYSRARNLHQAAKQIVKGHHGEFPRTRNEALNLRGIGNYTAAAVLSIAYGAPHAVLDGNVARVLARLGALRGDLRAPQQWRELANAADSLLDTNAPGDWNESMMELGATVCTPRAPNCSACPVQNACRARFLGIQDEIPLKRGKHAIEQVTLAAAVLLDPNGRTLLIRPKPRGGAGDPSALFSNLWQFPAVRVEKNRRVELERSLRTLRKTNGAQLKFNLHPLTIKRHTVTFREITLAPFLIRVANLPAADGMETKILPFLAVRELAVSSATRKIVASASAEILK
jgi:A/G-specific adenine glycosylase